jgi:hypothetical protein
MTRKARSDDDCDDREVFLGLGSLHDLNPSPTRKKLAKKNYGFIHFPDKPEPKRVVKVKPKRRKR